MKSHNIVDDMEEIFQSILATPKRQRRLLSKTFWDKFGFKARTQDRVEQVLDAIKKRSLRINLDEKEFGREDKDEWIILTYVDPDPPGASQTDGGNNAGAPRPPDSWFSAIESRGFESEREVEYYFVAPIMEQLGYEEDDFAIGYPVQMYQGVSKVTKEADFVLFDGKQRSKENSLLIVEAKRTGRPLTDDVAGQARAYAMWLTTPYYILTNGDDVKVFLFRGALLPDVVLLTFNRCNIRQHWASLYATLNKAAAIEYKLRLSEMLPPDS